MAEEVILVDLNDNMIGTMPKMEAHLQGRLHRAFSVFIFNSKGQLLLQQRVMDKYHSGGKWTNTCCSHPRPGEETIDAANRRLTEEMGMQSEIRHIFSFTYKANMMDDLFEYEYDHVFFGVTDQLPVIEPTEVATYKYVDMNELQQDIVVHPERYTEWLKICFNRIMDNYKIRTHFASFKDCK